MLDGDVGVCVGQTPPSAIACFRSAIPRVNNGTFETMRAIVGCCLLVSSILVTACMADAPTAPAPDMTPGAQVCNGGRWECRSIYRVAERASRHPRKRLRLDGPRHCVQPAVVRARRGTIAVVDAYGYPALESDLGSYRSAFGLLGVTVANGCLKIVKPGRPDLTAARARTPTRSTTGRGRDRARRRPWRRRSAEEVQILVVQADDDVGSGTIRQRRPWRRSKWQRSRAEAAGVCPTARAPPRATRASSTSSTTRARAISWQPATTGTPARPATTRRHRSS